MRTALALGALAAALGACSRESASTPASSSSANIVAAPPSSSSSSSSSTPAPAANDGTNPAAATLSPDDATFLDPRKGWGWGDRCLRELERGKLGWARAACDRALALPDLDPKARPALLYNEGLIAKQSGDAEAARSYFAESLRLRDASDPGRVEVAKELVSVDGSVPTATVETFKGDAIRAQMAPAHVKPAYTDLSFATLYHADIDNDGSLDWVLTERNSVGLHDDQIFGVYLSSPSSGVMIDSTTPMPNEGPFEEGNVTYFAEPFLRNDPEGVTMTLLEGPSQRATRYLWQRGHVRRLGGS